MGDNVFDSWWRFLKGYVTVTAEGFFLEKFTNLCALNRVPFWCIKREGPVKLVGETTISGFKKMRHLAKKCGCRVRLGNKKGAPFFLFRYRKRKTFIIGFLVFLAIIKITTLFIWRIEISGNNSGIEDEIVKQIYDMGYPIGTLKSKVDVNKLANLIMIGRRDLSWVGIDIEGTKMKVKVVEKVKIPEMIPKNIACDIIAGKPGLILEINTLEGTAKVKANDIVTTGQLLVSGVIEMKNLPEKNEYVHALADIKARVWYEKEKTLRLSKLKGKDEIEEIAYKIAYYKATKEISKDAEIVDVKRKTFFYENFVTVNVIIETLEDIGQKVILEQITN